MHDIEDNDILVVASDGIFDNLYDEDIIKCVNESMNQTRLSDPLEVSNCISNIAYELAKKSYYISPFAKHAHEMDKEGISMTGKEDDITVVVA